MKKLVSDLAVKGKKVIVRVDFNVPLKDGVINDDNRIVQALPTIQYLKKNGAKIILMSHLGKVDHKVPENTAKDMKKNDMKYVFPRLKELLGGNVFYCAATKGAELSQAVESLKDGEVLLVQNTRYEKGEEKNDPVLAAEWAKLAEAFVMDAFGSAHRAHASTYGIPELLNKEGKETAIGFLVEKEVLALTKCVEAKDHPYIAVLGGVKVSDKIKVIEGLLKKADKILIGGAMAYTFLKSQGVKVGRSLVEDASLEIADKFLKEANGKIILPVDYRVTDSFSAPTYAKVVTKIADDVEADDIGDETIKLFAKEMQGAKVIFWNGPMGVFENPLLAVGTEGVCKAISQVKGAFSVIGGGDSASAAAQLGYKDKFSHVSTGGGASLEMVENDGHLPGIDVIQDK